MKQRIILIIGFYFFFAFSSFAQTFKAFVKAGDKAMEKKEYYSASQYYQKALQIHDKRYGIVYKLATASYAMNNFKTAEKHYYKIARSSTERKNYPQVYYWLGMSQKQQGDYKDAQKSFNKYLKLDTDQGSLFHKKTQREIEACKLATQIMSQPTNTEITWLDKPINSKYSEFAPHLVGDSLYFSSLKYKVDVKPNETEKYISQVYFSLDNQKGKRIKSLKDETIHVANSSLSADNNTLFLTLCEGENNEDIICSIYQSTQFDGQWSNLKKLNETINLIGSSNTHPQLAFFPELDKEVLFFSSNRTGGQGAMDLYYAPLETDGTFGEAINLGANINTEEDDITPFFHSQTQTLYFSSTWHLGLGGMDVFKVSRIDNQWKEITNMGTPTNTSYNDVYFVINRDNKSGYLSSNRVGSLSFTKDEACCNDLYDLKFPEIEIPEPPVIDTPEIVIIPPVIDTPEVVIVPPPIVVDPPVEVPPVVLPPNDPPKIIPPTPVEELERMLPVTLYFHNDEPDSNTVRITTRINYKTHYDWYYSMKQEYMEKYSLGNQDLSYAVSDFFEGNIHRGYLDLNLFAEKLLEAVQNGFQLKVGIRGFTSPRSPTQYNFALAKRRINSAEIFFFEYREGIFIEYLKNGALEFYETPLGETTSPPGISDSYADRRNSIYSVEASRERRVEILEIKRVKN